jgi:hypothetical protein
MMASNPKTKKIEEVIVTAFVSIILIGLLVSCTSSLLKDLEIVTFSSGEIVFRKDGAQIRDVDYFPG